MAYKMRKQLAHRSNYGGARPTSNIKWIVVHYTANDGDHDEANATYFQSPNRNASAHYFVDDDSITQSVMDDHIAWSVGGSKWSDCSKTGGGKYYGICTNANSISIEMCDTKKDGKILATDATMDNAISLIKKLMVKYHIDIKHVIRHFDVNGKHCPAYFMGSSANEKRWKEFKEKITGDKLTSISFRRVEKSKPKLVGATNKDSKVAGNYVTTTSLNMRLAPGVLDDNNIICTIPKGKAVQCYGYYTNVKGTKWLYIAYGNKTGHVSSKYLRRK